MAVPFVGAVAGTLVVAEALRLLHGGPACAAIKLRLSRLRETHVTPAGTYTPQDAAGIAFAPAASVAKF